MAKSKNGGLNNIAELLLNADHKRNLHNLSFTDSLDSTMEKIKRACNDSAAMQSMHDSYGNTLTSTGTNDKVASFTNYGFDNDTLNWWLWLALYNDSWVFKRAIDKPSQDCVRTGITLFGEFDKDDIYGELTTYQFDLIQLLQWGALFGGSIAVMMFDNVADDEYKNPMNKRQIQTSKVMRMYITDRWYGVSQHGTEMVDDMLSSDFGKPKYYDVAFANGQMITVHHDYVLRYEHRTAPKLVKTGQLQGWGYAEGAHILNELSRDDQLKASIQSLVNKSLIEVIKMSGMRGVFMGADQDNEQQLKKRLEMVNWGRSYNSLTFLDKDDEYSQNQFGGLGGLSELLEKNMWLISSALEMQGVLYGDLKNGFSNDADALERYDNTIQNRCDAYYRPVLSKLLSVLYLKRNINEKVQFNFNSLLATKHNAEHMSSLKDYVALLSQLLGDGVISTKLYAQSLRSYASTGTIDFGLSDTEIEKLDNDFNSAFENIKVEETSDEQ